MIFFMPLTLLLTTSCCCAFVPSAPSSLVVPQQYRSSSTVPAPAVTSHVAVSMTTSGDGGGLFGRDGKFRNLFGTPSSSKTNDAESIEGPITIITIPTKNVKVGALRFILQVHLVSEQNKPMPKTWMIRQGDGGGNENGELQIYYADGTAMLSIQLQKSCITIQRHGVRPSLQYQLQESVLLHSVLDELSNIAFGVDDDNDNNIDESKRLLILQETNAIESARLLLPTKKS